MNSLLLAESHQEFDSYLLNVIQYNPTIGTTNAMHFSQQLQAATNYQSAALTASSGGGNGSNINNLQNNQIVSPHQQHLNQQVMLQSGNLQQSQQQHNNNMQQLPALNQTTQFQNIQQQPQQQHHITLNTVNVQINPNTSENSEIPLIIADENAPPQPGPTMLIAHVIKSLLKFLSHDTCQPLWNYEDMTAKGEFDVITLCWFSFYFMSLFLFFQYGALNPPNN